VQEVTYEAYGPGGTGLVIFCLTDNLNRTASEVKPTVTKAGAKVRCHAVAKAGAWVNATAPLSF
jgi:transcriptional/translational regulatory protein YebC/TACO1